MPERRITGQASATLPPQSSISASERDSTVLAFDFGERRTGVAVGDARLRTAHPLKPIAAIGTARFRAIGALLAVVGGRHVRKARPEPLVIRADQRIGTLQVDVIAQHDERALPVVEIDAAGGVREDDCPHAHPCEHAHRKHDLARAVPFVEMHAALEDGDRDAAAVAQDERSCMAGDGRRHEVGDLPRPGGD